MTAPNPLANTYSTAPPAVSSKTFPIAGILTTVYGLEELPPSCNSVSCLWLLHPRLQTKDSMAQIASTCVGEWNRRQKHNVSKGLIAVAFDQRNHGSREVDKLANEAWRAGNPRHAQDMFSVYHGTAMDTSLLLDHLGSYIFPDPDAPTLDQNFILGVSLGGHAAWQVLFQEPRVSAAVVIIGCPDYIRVMTDRARLSKLETYVSSNGKSFLGSKDFPDALVRSVQKLDPKGLLFGLSDINPKPSYDEQARLSKILDATIKGKSVLVCSGGADKLVPYHCSAPFMTFLKNATQDWYAGGNLYVEDNVYEGIGHATSEGMVKDAVRFLGDIMEGKALIRGNNASKM